MQVFMNHLYIFVFPFLLGALVRLMFRKEEKGWIVSPVVAVVSGVLTVVAFAAPNYGIAANALLMYQAVCLLAGSLLTGAVLWIIRLKKGPDDPENIG